MLDLLEGSEPDTREVEFDNNPDFPMDGKHRLALNFLRGPQKHSCLVGGSRSGKTSLIVRCIIERALRAPGSRHLICRYRANAVNASVWADTYRKVMRLAFPGIKSKRKQLGYEEFSNGAEIWFGGLDEAERVEKILGMEFATIYAGECSQIPYSSILVLRTRLAQPGTKLKLRGFYDLNPTTKLHWTNVEFGEKRDPIGKLKLANPEDFDRFFLNPKDNERNLDPSYIKSLENMPKAYRERFYEGKYVDSIENALWTPDLIEVCREDPIEPDNGRRLAEFQRVAVAVDPSGALSKADIKSDDIGICVAGKRTMSKTVILEDNTIKGGPKDWGRAAVAAYKRWGADLIVAEANYGGAMVKSTIQAVDPNVPVKLVNASRGKHVRAEPVAALYEEGKVTHAGMFPELEDELCQFATDGYKGDRSPNRADAAIWAITELMLGEQSTYTLEFVR